MAFFNRHINRVFVSCLYFADRYINHESLGMTTKIWAETKTDNYGVEFSLRYLLDDAELEGLQNAGLIGEVEQVMGMQEITDCILADMELQIYTACGGRTQ